MSAVGVYSKESQSKFNRLILIKERRCLFYELETGVLNVFNVSSD
jgi:hypothetical protein